MPTKLLFLPFELLLLIVQYLDWTDILRLRQTCKVLYEATRERAVVQNLVVRYCMMFPATAFSLDRPISMHTTEQLERIIRRNEAAHRGWGINAPHLYAPFVPKKREIHLNHVAKTFCLIEGGRWLLVVRITGSVDYYDLEDEGSVSKTLIPDLTQRRPWTMVLVATDRDYNEPVLTFNMAIYTRTWLGFVAEQLQVWRITLELDDNHSGVGLVANHVVTLSLGTEYTPSDISLCGKYIAWDYVERVDNVCLNVVNWMDAAISNQAKINSTYGSTPVKTTIGKKVVHPAPEMPAFRLLPGNFAIIASRPTIRLYDLSAIPDSLVDDVSTGQPTPHIWETSLPSLFPPSLSNYFLCLKTSTVRFAVYTRDTVHGLIFPLRRNSTSERERLISSEPAGMSYTAPRICQLARYVVNSEQCGFSSGYRTAVLHTFEPQTVIIRYRWPDDVPDRDTSSNNNTVAGSGSLKERNTMNSSDFRWGAHFPRREDASLPQGIQQKMIPITCRNWSPFTPVMDEGSGRVIYSAQTGKQLVVADFSRY